MNAILTIWKKELKDTIRDRRTMAAMVIMPLLLMPLLIIGMGKLVDYQQSNYQSRVATVSVSNQNVAPEFIAFLKAQKKLKVVKPAADPEAALRNGDIDIAITLPKTFQADLKSGTPITASLMSYSTRTESGDAISKVNEAIAVFNNRILGKRLKDAGVDPRSLTPLVVTEKDVATAKERGGFGLGFMLPMFFVVWAIVGGQYTATDLSAGEKERKTLEALLLTPAKRHEIVIGKFLAVSTTAMTSVVLALASLYFALKEFGFGPMNGGRGAGAQSAASIGIDYVFSIEPLTFAIMLGIGLLLVALFSALLLSICIFAKSFKEAQNYISPVYIAAILPVVAIGMLPNLNSASWVFAIPVANAVVLFKELLMGQYVGSHIVLTGVSLALVAAIAIAAAVKIFDKEKVLFK